MGGFFGTVSKAGCVTDLFYGTDYNSHLGTRRGGMATYDAEKKLFTRSIHNLESTYFRTKFEDELDKFAGNSGIGIISDTDAQPIIINSHLGRFAIVTVAKIQNIDELENELLAQNMHFAELSSGKTNQTELIALLIIQGKNFVEGIENVYNRIKGSCSMLLLTEDGIIAARDKWGRTPIVIGRKDGAYAASSESSSFPNLDYEIDSYLGPGEIVRMRPDGLEQLRKPNEQMQICSFLWVYYGFPTSCYEGRNVEEVRFLSGLKMGQTDASEVDCACGIPDSGVGMALGYAEGKGVPYHRAIAKYTPTWPRSFTPSRQELRNLVAKMKLIPNRAMLQGKRVLFCDDSIVRGTQLRDNVKVLFDCGAREVHIRIACPPLIYACPFIGFTASRSDLELITRRIIKELEGDENKNLEKYAATGSPEYEKLVDVIRQRFGLNSLKFNTLETLVESIGLPKCKLCTHCFDGTGCF
ncbi:MAG TPA: amidophosphoribosyltransferase [Candidatus Bacteroides avicola]|uniref:Amidophosphoribosyltransferase n=1 Tax=Candidatus Bacteroides avicola TaxID=2838468 RepID=A0A9D2KV88_9BACE|nr:amidophosphoribosyltransferase [Bacteroidales bacterium SW292]HJA85833.1 amidophosphoribosyltransferase [Candidatus Bacteroides avicola]